MTKITAITRCLSQGKNLSSFHYRGEIQGQLVKGISVAHSSHRNFRIGKDYIMRLQVLGHNNGIMNCKLITGQDINKLKRSY